MRGPCAGSRRGVLGGRALLSAVSGPDRRPGRLALPLSCPGPPRGRSHTCRWTVSWMRTTFRRCRPEAASLDPYAASPVSPCVPQRRPWRSLSQEGESGSRPALTGGHPQGLSAGPTPGPACCALRGTVKEVWSHLVSTALTKGSPSRSLWLSATPNSLVSAPKFKYLSPARWYPLL